ncbi:phage holin family protein [Shewanella algae]|uniref:phage holin family protein n=1 Tax=Shewanella algae TaxID=38313 RepID=UPI00313AE345
MEIDIIFKVIAGTATIFGIFQTISTLHNNRENKKSKNFETYKRVKDLLSKQPINNYAEMCAALNCLIRRELSLDEIKWFIDTPNAFRHLQTYCSQARYIEISENGDSFKYNKKLSNKKSRMLEQASLIFAYGVLTSVGLVILLLTYSLIEWSVYVILAIIFSVALIVFGVLALIQGERLRDTKSTMKLKFVTVDTLPKNQKARIYRTYSEHTAMKHTGHPKHFLNCKEVRCRVSVSDK